MPGNRVDWRRALTLDEKYFPPAKKSGSRQPPRCATYPTLVKELFSLLPTDEKTLGKVAEQAVEALDHWTPHMYRLIVSNVVKHEHPDTLALRFLRTSNWDFIEAIKMMGKTIYWRTMEAAMDDDVIKEGEGGACEDKTNNRGNSFQHHPSLTKQGPRLQGQIHLRQTRSRAMGCPNQIMAELGGDKDWAYEYEEPGPDENARMNDTPALYYSATTSQAGAGIPAPGTYYRIIMAKQRNEGDASHAAAAPFRHEKGFPAGQSGESSFQAQRARSMATVAACVAGALTPRRSVPWGSTAAPPAIDADPHIPSADSGQAARDVG
ncbi:hypothetical protein E4U21_005212 [Claviceps maximensis]|nr:hypothetical protein E4U21_005212 [Claviceps maximensis]